MMTAFASPKSETSTSPTFMQHVQLPFEQTNQFSSLFLDYIQEKENLKSFYGHFPKLENFSKQIADKQGFSTEHRQVLVNALKQQYAAVANAPIQQIDSLANDSTFTVTTGHQLNIFSGPLYFIYKIVSTINLAKQLNEKYPDTHVVPVYWMATEDHDFEEIAHFRLFNQRYEWEKEAKGAVGHLSTEGLGSILEAIKEMPEFFRKAYGENKTLAQATLEYVHHLFADQELIVLDADNAALKTLFRPAIKADLLHDRTAASAMATTTQLEEIGYKPQIHIREINFFYLEKGIRERIEKQEGVYRVINTDLSFSEAELEALIDKHPERFSPNVVMRPVYQECILPNIAYLGGPSEVAYWLQLKGVFETLNVPFPIIMPRNFAMVVGQNIAKKMDKLAVKPSDLFKDLHTLKTELIHRNTETEIQLGTEMDALQALFEQIAAKAIEVDKSLDGFVKAEGQKSLKSLQNIEKRLKKSEERKQDTSINQLTKLKDQLFPNNSAQERVDNFLNFYLNDPEFITKMLQQLDPLDFRMNVFVS